MLESVVAGDPGVVAVGDHGTILFSPEGISWTAVDSGTTAYLNDVVWTGSAFFAVGDGGVVVKAIDGVNWVSLVTDTSLDLLRVAFGAGVLVAVGNDTNLLTSNDGTSWVVTELDWWAETDDVVWTGTQFIVVGPSLAATSVDGWQWQSEYEFGHDSDSCSYPKRVTWTGSEAVALYHCFGRVFSSPDGSDWTTVFTAGSDGPWSTSITWSDGMFIAFEENGGVWIASDPSSWMRVGAPPSRGYSSVAWTGKRFIAVGWSGGIITSRTGADWTDVRAVDGPLGDFKGLAAGNGVLVGVSQYGNEAVSSDGFDWSAVPWAGWFRDAAFGNGRFVGVTSSESGVSSDGMSWSFFDTGTSALRAVEWVGDRFLAVRHFHGLIIGSVDGELWSVEYPGTVFSDRWYGLGVGQGSPVAVGIDDPSNTPAVLIERSPGIWEKTAPFLDSGLDGSLRDITFGAGRWVAVGTYGKVVASTDLDTWQVIDSGVEESLYSISWNGSEFLAAGSGGIVISSPNGLAWTRETTLTNLYLDSVEWFDDAWYVAGSGGTVLRGGCTWPADPPVAAFSLEPADPAPGEVIRFTDATLGFATSWSWLFGGGFSTDINPSHVYSAPGSYDVTQTVCSPAGCSQAIDQLNVTERPPKAAFAWRYPVLLSNEPATWLDLSSGPPGSWTWDFGDGFRSTDREPSHAYADTGIYTTRLDVTNSSGSDRAEAQVVVGPAPVVMTSGGGWYEDIVWDGSRWLAARDGAVAMSTNGLAWSEHEVAGAFYPEGIAWTGEEYVAAGYQFIAVSEDGLTWSFTEMAAEAFTDVATCDGVTVVVGNGGRVLVSSDLVSWQAGTSGAAGDIRRVACGGGLFVATVNGSPSIIESANGLSWTPAAGDAGTSSSALVWADGAFFVGTSDNGVVTRSPHGTWTRVDEGLYSPSYLTDLAAVNGLILASGDDSLWWLSPELLTWVPIEGSGNDRMAIADATVMILNQRDIHSLAVQPLHLFSDGFESGDPSAWSAAIQ